MLLLVYGELRVNWRGWLSVLAVTTVASACLYLAIGVSISSSGASDPEAREFMGGTGAMAAVMNCLAAIVCVSISAGLTVRTQQHAIAIWKLAGLIPHQVRFVVSSEVIATSALGSLLGVALGCGLWPAYTAELASSLKDDSPAAADIVGHVTPSGVALCLAPVIVLAVAFLGSYRPARQGAQVEAVLALRERERSVRSIGPFRAIAALVCVLGLVGIWRGISSAKSGPPESAMDLSIFYLGVVILGACSVVALGPLILKAVTWAWTLVLPVRFAPSAFLARNSALDHIGYSSSVITPVVVASCIAGSMFQMLTNVESLGVALGERDVETNGDWTVFLALFGGAIAVCLVTAAASVFTSSRDRGREAALVRVTGAAPNLVLRQGLWECLIYAITSTILSLGIIMGSTVLMTSAFRASVAPSMALRFDPAPTLLIACLGSVVVAVGTLIPIMSARRVAPLIMLAKE